MVLVVVLGCFNIENPTVKLVTEVFPIVFILGFFVNAYTISREREIFVQG